MAWVWLRYGLGIAGIAGVAGMGLRRSHSFEPEGGVAFELGGLPLRVDVLVPLLLPNNGRNAPRLGKVPSSV